MIEAEATARSGEDTGQHSLRCLESLGHGVRDALLQLNLEIREIEDQSIKTCEQFANLTPKRCNKLPIYIRTTESLHIFHKDGKLFSFVCTLHIKCNKTFTFLYVVHMGISLPKTLKNVTQNLMEREKKGKERRPDGSIYMI